jgi:hypothetical protein
MGFDDVGHALHRGTEHGQRVLGVQALAIAVEPTTSANSTVTWRCFRKGRPAAGRPGGAQRRGGHLDHGIAQGRALGLQRRDGGQHGFDVSGLHVSRSVGC